MKTGLVAVTAVIFALVGWVGARLNAASTPPQVCTAASCTVTVSRSWLVWAAVDYDTSVVTAGYTLKVTAPGTTFKPPGVTFANNAVSCSPDPHDPTTYNCPITAATPKAVPLKYTVTLSGAFPYDPYVVNN